MDAKTFGCNLAFERIIIVARQFLFVKLPTSLVIVSLGKLPPPTPLALSTPKSPKCS